MSSKDGITEQNNTGHSKDAARTSGNGPPPEVVLRTLRDELRSRQSEVVSSFFKSKTDSLVAADADASINASLNALGRLRTFVTKNYQWIVGQCAEYLDDCGNDTGLSHWNYMKWLTTDVESLLKLNTKVVAARVTRKKAASRRLLAISVELQPLIGVLDGLVEQSEFRQGGVQ